MSYEFTIGTIYNRQKDIHSRFGGQRQGGIITPADRRAPIIIVTGESGAVNGYDDQVLPDGTLEYFGEGQRGDMTMNRGNLAILNHQKNNRDLFVFNKTRQGLRFLGQYYCAGYREQQGTDRDRAPRTAIVFLLKKLDEVKRAES